MEFPGTATIQERQIVIIVPEPEPRPRGPSAYDTAIKRPAGQVGTEPQFTLYLGTNTGPYQTSDNGTLVLPPVPIEWIIAPLNVTDGQCHSRSENLGLFGITNILVMALSILTGCRPLVRYLTRGLLGKPSKYSAFWTWIISFSFQIASNAIISHIVVSTPGYQHLSMLNVFALYASRPRINQIWMGSLRSLVGPVRLSGRLAFLAPQPKEEKKMKKNRENEQRGEKRGTNTTANTNNLKEAYPYFYDEYIRWRTAQTEQQQQDQPPPQEVTNPWRLHYETDPEWVYTDSYVATSISEFCLQLVSAIFVGITWRRFPNAPIREHMKTYVNLMIAAPTLALLGWLFSGASGVLTMVLFFVGLTGFFTYGASWLYWGHFLDLPGSLWCPPKFVTQAAMWSSFSALSTAVGALL
ncbi:hypothetical protein NKR19_g7543 [Coniochaeta hoffmannii]|uniref:Uncharacterized protein n=1 Tax=Coniochaeta hoffmannii TaxID=91930 RepID=A0AA38VM32_9PEZI|nr:hypothetical protein NKR19_g7543 [Coniochaeta hoffmannii]